MKKSELKNLIRKELENAMGKKKSESFNEIISVNRCRDEHIGTEFKTCYDIYGEVVKNQIEVREKY